MSSTVPLMEPKDEQSSLLTLGEVMAYLRVNARTAYRLIRTGELPAYRVGRQWRIRRGDFDQWMDSHRVAPPGDRPTAQPFPAAGDQTRSAAPHDTDTEEIRPAGLTTA